MTIDSRPEGLRQAAQLTQAERLREVRYDIRGEILGTVRELEAAGAQIIQLNVGNPAQFGLNAPEWLQEAVRASIPSSDPYTESRGLLHAREAVAKRYADAGLPGASADRVFLGNGVSELILMAVQALANPGDEILVPAPDYPLWTAAARLTGASAVHYRCPESRGWVPEVAEVESLVTERTKALVLINPNNPTGAVYPPEVVSGLIELADRHGLVLLSDEIYDEIIYAPAPRFTSVALQADQVPHLVFGGLSKVWRAAGYRGGWMMMSPALAASTDLVEGLDLLASLRLCPNVMAQQAIGAAAGRVGDSDELIGIGGALRAQRDRLVDALSAIDGVSCVRPDGALYAFPRIEAEAFRFGSDQELALTFLTQEHVLLSHGSGFNLPADPHVRFVFLAGTELLDEACARFARHLDRYRA